MIKKYNLIASVFTLFFLQYNNAQVGIGTSNPQATLHVEGSLRVTSTNNITTSDRIIGTGAEGDITAIVAGNGLLLKDNVLSTTSSPTKYKITAIPITTTAPNQVFDNMNYDLEGANKEVVIFRLAAGHNYTIAGLSGGVDGRHLIIYNSTSVNLSINNMSSSIPANNIDTLGSATATSGVGTIEFVYDGTIGKWIVINLRN